jgi:hypothetical protein
VAFCAESGLHRVVAYGDEWMPLGGETVKALASRIAELQELCTVSC